MSSYDLEAGVMQSCRKLELAKQFEVAQLPLTFALAKEGNSVLFRLFSTVSQRLRSSVDKLGRPARVVVGTVSGVCAATGVSAASRRLPKALIAGAAVDISHFGSTRLGDGSTNARHQQ